MPRPSRLRSLLRESPICWERFESHCESNPEEVESQIRGCFGPLSWLLCHNPPLHVFELIWEAHKDKIMDPKHVRWNDTPLCQSCRQPNVHPSIIHLLLESDVSAASKMDKRGWYPLHYTTDASVAEALIGCYPLALGRLNGNGCLPLHYAAKELYCRLHSPSSQGLQEGARHCSCSANLLRVLLHAATQLRLGDSTNKYTHDHADGGGGLFLQNQFGQTPLFLALDHALNFFRHRTKLGGDENHSIIQKDYERQIWDSLSVILEFAQNAFDTHHQRARQQPFPWSRKPRQLQWPVVWMPRKINLFLASSSHSSSTSPTPLWINEQQQQHAPFLIVHAMLKISPCPIDLIFHAMNYFSKDLSTHDAQGRHVLEILLTANNNNNNNNDETCFFNHHHRSRLLKHILKVCPMAASIPSKQKQKSGLLPLHMALEEAGNDNALLWEDDCLHCLISAYPDALVIPHRISRLYPFMMVAVNEETQAAKQQQQRRQRKQQQQQKRKDDDNNVNELSRLNTCFQLLLEDPTAICIQQDTCIH